MPDEIEGFEFVDYDDERHLDDVMRLVSNDLSEPYSGTSVRPFVICLSELLCIRLPRRFPPSLHLPILSSQMAKSVCARSSNRVRHW